METGVYLRELEHDRREDRQTERLTNRYYKHFFN